MSDLGKSFTKHLDSSLNRDHHNRLLQVLPTWHAFTQASYEYTVQVRAAGFQYPFPKMSCLLGNARQQQTITISHTTISMIIEWLHAVSEQPKITKQITRQPRFVQMCQWMHRLHVSEHTQEQPRPQQIIIFSKKEEKVGSCQVMPRYVVITHWRSKPTVKTHSVYSNMKHMFSLPLAVSTWRRNYWESYAWCWAAWGHDSSEIWNAV